MAATGCESRETFRRSYSQLRRQNFVLAQLIRTATQANTAPFDLFFAVQLFRLSDMINTVTMPTL